MVSRTLSAATVAVIVLLAGCAGAGTPPVAGGNNGSPEVSSTSTSASASASASTVTVGASATVEAAPDLAVVRVAVEATADSAEAARAAVAGDAEPMRAALRDAGVPDANVILSDITT